jgi:hypothetical protein
MKQAALELFPAVGGHSCASSSTRRSCRTRKGVSTCRHSACIRTHRITKDDRPLGMDGPDELLSFIRLLVTLPSHRIRRVGRSWVR